MAHLSRLVSGMNKGLSSLEYKSAIFSNSNVYMSGDKKSKFGATAFHIPTISGSDPPLGYVPASSPSPLSHTLVNNGSLYTSFPVLANLSKYEA